MADLDAELLALADGDSSSDEGPSTTAKITDSAPPAGSPRSKGASSTAAAAPKKAAKSKTGAAKGSKSKRADSEEGEVSSQADSPDSLDSAPMSESEGDDSAGGAVDKDAPLFPLENMFYNEKDKAEIMALSEVNREAILAERASMLDRKKQDQVIQRLFKGYQTKEGKSKADDGKKRKAGTADLEEGQRKSSRQKTTLGGRKVGETSDAMVAYKRQREQKGALAEQRKTEFAERKARKGSEGSDADADGESEVEWGDSKTKNGIQESVPRRDEPAELIDFEHARLGRAHFAQVCFYPGFDDAIKNCYTRVSIGPDKSTGENVYRVAKIEAFNEGAPYALEGPNGKPFTTTQYAVVSVGKARKEWPFFLCSNAKFTEREFDRYKKTLEAEGLPFPTKAALISKVDDINALINHKFTEEELQIKLRRSGVLQQKHITLERHALQIRRKEAEYRGDKVAMEKLDAELAKLEGPKLAFGTSLVKPVSAPAGKTQQERLAEINRANRKANTQNVRKAQLAERKAEAIQRAAVERGEAVANPFARVKVRATTHHDVNALSVPKTKPAPVDDLFEGSDASRAATPLSGVTTPSKVKSTRVGPNGVLRTAEEMASDKVVADAVRNVLFGPPDRTKELLNFDELIDWKIVPTEGSVSWSV